jgi:hypothetical protein
MTGWIGLALGIVGLVTFAWSWSKMPNILKDLSNKDEQ